MWSSDGLESGAAKSGHFVEDVGAYSGFCLLVWKASRFQFGTDDHLPTAHLCFPAAALIVSGAHLPSHATSVGYGGNVRVTKRWLVSLYPN